MWLWNVSVRTNFYQCRLPFFLTSIEIVVEVRNTLFHYPKANNISFCIVRQCKNWYHWLSLVGFGWNKRENISTWSWSMDLAVLFSYAVASSQISSRLALPLSQKPIELTLTWCTQILTSQQLKLRVEVISSCSPFYQGDDVILLSKANTMINSCRWRE